MVFKGVFPALNFQDAPGSSPATESGGVATLVQLSQFFFYGSSKYSQASVRATQASWQTE